MADTKTITIVIDADIDRELDHVVASTGHSKPTLVRDALIEWLEDWEDARDAEEITARNEPTLSSDDVRRELGLAHILL